MRRSYVIESSLHRAHVVSLVTQFVRLLSILVLVQNVAAYARPTSATNGGCSTRACLFIATTATATAATTTTTTTTTTNTSIVDAAATEDRLTNEGESPLRIK